MDRCGLIIITGMPGTGKTTLARSLAQRACVPLIVKDTIKEPLLEVLDSGGGDAVSAQSDLVAWLERSSAT